MDRREFDRDWLPKAKAALPTWAAKLRESRSPIDVAHSLFERLQDVTLDAATEALNEMAFGELDKPMKHEDVVIVIRNRSREIDNYNRAAEANDRFGSVNEQCDICFGSGRMKIFHPHTVNRLLAGEYDERIERDKKIRKMVEGDITLAKNRKITLRELMARCGQASEGSPHVKSKGISELSALCSCLAGDRIQRAQETRIAMWESGKGRDKTPRPPQPQPMFDEMRHVRVLEGRWVFEQLEYAKEFIATRKANSIFDNAI